MLAVFLLVIATQTAAPADPFATLRDAYARRDAQLAAAAYDDQAEVVYRYEGVAEERYRGSDAIRASFASLFGSIEPTIPLDLNFRITARDAQNVQGIYRLRVGRSTSAYGRFVTKISVNGRFSFDESGSASRDDFEEAAGPVHLAADIEDLDRSYYAAMAGRYRLPDGCLLVVTRSVARLFVRNSCTQQWRGLSRISGRHWTAGNRVIDPTVVTHYRFAPFSARASSSLTITKNGVVVEVAERADSYTTDNVAFTTADGTQLTGTLYVPRLAKDRPAATVMVHGSGPQDRDGFASIIAVMADEIAANGRVVLVYDKRGSGQSAGDGDRAGFDMLAGDAIAAMEFLRKRKDVDPARIGLAGSSQAGWIAARAIELGGQPADVLLLGAAGAAITVREQNLYNTEMQMRCAGLPPSDRRLALAQQSAFFYFLADPKHAAALNRLTVRARNRPKLADWLFPSSDQINRTDNSWYNVLSVDYDPLPVWRKYKGKTQMLFGTLDDATPTARAISRLKGAGPKLRILPSAQHLGLTAATMCKASLSDVDQYHPDLFAALGDFAKGE